MYDLATHCYRYVNNGARKSCYIRACEQDGGVTDENLQMGRTNDNDGRIVYVIGK